MANPENTKDDPIKLDWAESPNVDLETHWVEDDGSTYPREFVNVNGVLFLPEDAKTVSRKIREELEGS